MHLFLCDDVLDRMVDSLLEQVRACYKGQPYPELVSLGHSGKDMIDRLRKRMQPEELSQLRVHDIELGDKGMTIQDRYISAISNRSLLVCDNIVNTGKTLRNARQHFLDKGAKDVRTLSAIVRDGSSFIPNFCAMTIAQHDQVYFGLRHYPVPAFTEGSVRTLEEADRGIKFDTADYMDPHLDDYLYRMHSDSTYRAYVIEPVNSNKPVGLVAYRLDGPDTAFIDAWIVDNAHKGKKYGESLMRFFDAQMRGLGVLTIRMLAIEGMVSKYEIMGYKAADKKVRLACGTFIEMTRSTSR